MFFLNTKGNLGKFDSKYFWGCLCRCFNTSKIFRVSNKSTLTIEDSMHLKFEESLSCEECYRDWFFRWWFQKDFYERLTCTRGGRQENNDINGEDHDIEVEPIQSFPKD